MTCFLRFLPILSLLMLRPSTAAEPLAIDLTNPAPLAPAASLGQGTSKNPQGVELSADSRSFFLGGKPWVPVCGEFHYSRYPQSEWREELLKMKAGGITVVSTYVFWIHHEEQQGKMSWQGNLSLQHFLQLCDEVGLKAIVRMGPWCHGEVRNGGLPDWVQNSGTKLRTADPAFMALVKPFFAQTAEQMKGLLWKDGGPVIAAQMENECHRPEYLLALKDMAREVGVDVPFYTMTGWNRVPIPKAGLLPLFGAYVDGFWGGTPESYRKSFLFSNVRDDGDLGAQMENVRPARNQSMAGFPFACCEIGPGMMSSYKKRVMIDPFDTAAMALVKLGSGNNMPGYYMYHGGVNPDGKLTTLQEEKPNFMPIKDYDFQTALGATGEARRQYGLLRQQHLLLAEMGDQLARMPAYFPEKSPADLKDTTTFRWSMRADAAGNGFVFWSNRQPVLPLPAKENVQLQLKRKHGNVLVPTQPIDIAEDSFGIWPVGMSFSGIALDYATVQPLCHVEDDNGNTTWFFGAAPEVRSEIAVHGKDPQVVNPGTDIALKLKKPDGKTVSFVVLEAELARSISLQQFAGKNRAIISNVTAFADGGTLRATTTESTFPMIALYPPLPSIQVGLEKIEGRADGIFSRFDLPHGQSEPQAISKTLIKVAGVKATQVMGDKENTWHDAAEYQVNLPKNTSPDQILSVQYFGDAARISAEGRLLLDQFSNGEPLRLPLWRIAKENLTHLRLKVLPWSDAISKRMPESTKLAAHDATKAGKLDDIQITLEAKNTVTIKP